MKQLPAMVNVASPYSNINDKESANLEHPKDQYLSIIGRREHLDDQEKELLRSQ